MASRKLIVEIVGDSRQLDRTFARASRNGKAFQRDMALAFQGGASGLRGLGNRNAYAAVAITGALAFNKLAQSASDLHEQVTRTSVVFGSSSDAIMAWSRTTADAMGIAQVDALKAADNFGTMFATIGLGKQDAASMSQRLVGLAADLAAFNNEDPTEMLDRLRAGLSGEAEPLRRFGVLLSEARTKQEAYRTGLARAGTQLTEAQKVQARYQLILKDSTLAQGNFAATSEDLAQKQRRLKARWADLQTQLGEGLIPVMSGAIDVALELADAFEKIGDGAEWADNKMGGMLGKLGKWAAFTGLARFSPLGAAALAVRRLTGGGGGGGREPLVRGESAADKVPGSGGIDRLPPLKRGATVEQRNAWWDAMIGRRENRVQDIESLRGQIEELRKIAQLIEQRIKATKDITRKLNLEDELLNVQRQIKGAQEAIQARREQLREERRLAAEERREREREAAERARQARVTAQFAVLGLTAEGEKPLPRLANLRRQLEQLSRRVAGTAVGGRNRVMLNAIRKLLALDELEPEVREKIRDIFQAIREELGKGTNNLKTNWGRKINPQTFLDSLGLNLTAAEQRRLRAGVAALGPGGRTTPGTSTAFVGGGGVVVHGDLVLTGVQNTRQLEAEIARRSRSRAKTRRGAG